jgi:hypothetical protein
MNVRSIFKLLFVPVVALSAVTAAGAVLSGGGQAMASDNPCISAHFVCGDEVQASSETTMGLGFVAGAPKAGSKVTAGWDTFSAYGTDWKVIADGTTVAFEDAPGGKPNGLFLGVGIGAKSTVTLEPFSDGWLVHWNAQPAKGGTEYVNDMTGEALQAPHLGQVLRTGHLHTAGIYRFRGNALGS